MWLMRSTAPVAPSRLGWRLRSSGADGRAPGGPPANKRQEPSPPHVEEDVGLIAQQHSLALSLGAPGRVGRRGSDAIR